MMHENAWGIDSELNSVSDRQAAIVDAYREIASRPAYLASATTGWDFWSHGADEILEICILESDGRILFESLVKPRGSISAYSYTVHRITQRMVEHAPTWAQVLPDVKSALARRRVAVYDTERQMRFLRQTHAQYNLPWTFDEQMCFCVKHLYANFNRKVYAGGLTSPWLGLWRAARNFGIAHGKWHRAGEDAQITRAVLKQMARHCVPHPPSARLPRESLIQKWLGRWLDT